MIKQMTWLPLMGAGELILHLRASPTEPWRPYTMFPQFVVADYKISKGSRGYSTFQKLLEDGWEVVSREQAMQVSLFSSSLPKKYGSNS